MVPSPQLSDLSTPHSRETQCAWGSTEQGPTGNLAKMVCLSLSNRDNLVELGDPVGRSICNQIHCQTPSVCVTSARGSSMGSGCYINRLVTPVGRCLPCKPSTSRGLSEDAKRAMHGPVDRPTQTRETLVPAASTTSHRPTLVAPRQGGPASPTMHRFSSSRPKRSSLTRLEIIERANRDQSFSASIAGNLPQPDDPPP